jgi:O-antigen ligase
MNSISSRASIPNPTPLLFLMAGTVAWCLVWVEDPGSPWLLLVLALAAFVLVPASVSVLASRPSFAVTVLMVAVVMPRLFVQISGLKARPEHLAVGLMLLALPFWWKQPRERVKWFLPDYLLVAYLGANLVSSLVMSVSPSQTIRWALQQVIVVLAYFLLRVLVVDRESFRHALNIMLVIGTLEAAFAILCFYSNLLFGTGLGMEIGQYGSIPGTFGTQYEANILGSYCGACCAMMLAMYLRKKEQKFLLGFAVTFAAMAISLSRGALVGTLFGLVVVVYRCRKDVDLHRAGKLAVAMLGIAITIAPAVLGLWNERFSNIDVSDIASDDTTRDRVLTLGLAFEGFSEHPVMGNGTSSFQLQFNGPDYGLTDQAGWIANSEARILYDTGVVGFGLFFAFLLSLGVEVKRLLKKAPNLELEALAMATVVYWVSFQFTEGTLLAFSWVHLGLIAAGLAIFRTAGAARPNPLSGTTPDFSQ